MKVLHLTLKKKWFGMIASGEKKEEYRDIKKHWAVRLQDGFAGTFGIDKTMPCKEFDVVIFRNGYSGGSPLMSVRIEKISIGTGKEEWGAEPGKEYYVIKLGDIISNPHQ